MAGASKGRVRVSGVVLIICAVFLFGMGLYLLYIGLNWTLPTLVPEAWRHAPQGPELMIRQVTSTPVGSAGLYLVVFGVVGGLNGLWMAGFGTRNWVLTMPLILLFLIFIGVGAWATLDQAGFSAALEQMKG